MSKVSNVFSNSAEDFVDEFATTVVMRNAKKVFDPLKKDFEGSDSAFDEALLSAVTTLQMGISMLAINYVTATVLPQLSKRAVIFFAYIVGGKVIKGLASKIKNVSGTAKLFGKLTGNLLGTIEQRQERAKIANDFINNADRIHMEHMKISNDTRLSMESTYMKSNASFANKSLALYTEKTKMGSWTKSSADKKIYERATGQKLKAGVSWAKLSVKLNEFSEFARSAEDEVISLAQVQFDHMTANGVTRVN